MNRKEKTNLIGLDINRLEVDDFQRIFSYSGKKLFVVKVNSEFLNRALKDKDFFDTLKTADIIIPDGIGVLWSAKYLSLPLAKLPIVRQLQALWQVIYTGASLVFAPSYCKYPIPRTIPGLQALELMLKAAIDHKASVYIFGAYDDVLEKAIKALNNKFPNLNIVGSYNGYEFDNEKVIKMINASGAKLLVVAQGSPRQEYWIRDNYDKLKNVKVAVGDGGSLEFLAGTYKKTPRILQKLGLEWFWRLFMHKNMSPQIGKKTRIGRVWQAVPVFIMNIVKYKLENE